MMMMIFKFPAQHYRPQMFLDNLTSSMQSAAAASTSAALVSPTNSHYDTSSHETRVITGGSGATGAGTDSGISDIISLDWSMSPSQPFQFRFHHILCNGQVNNVFKCHLSWFQHWGKTVLSLSLCLHLHSLVHILFPGVEVLLWSVILGKSAACSELQYFLLIAFCRKKNIECEALLMWDTENLSHCYMFCVKHLRCQVFFNT